MVVTKDYANAYKEVLEILKYTKKEDVNKIPKYKIIWYQTFMNPEHNFKVEKDKGIEEQKISKEAKAILANLFIDFWASDYQKERIKAKDKYDLEQIEKEKSEKYNPDSLFKNKQNCESNTTETVSMIEYKENNIFKKIINKIKSFFKKT